MARKVQRRRPPGLTTPNNADPNSQYVKELQETVTTLRDRLSQLERDKIEERAVLNPWNPTSPLSFRRPVFDDQIKNFVNRDQLKAAERTTSQLRRDFELHEHDAVDSSIFSSSYDAVADTYTLSWTAFDVMCDYFGDAASSPNVRNWAPKTVAAGSFTWAAQIYPPSFKIYIQPTLEVLTGPYLYGCRVDLKWGGSLTGSDAATQNAQMTDATSEIGRVGDNIMQLSGGSAGAKAALVIDWPNSGTLMAAFSYAYDKGTTTVSMPMYSMPGAPSTNKPDFRSKNVGVSFASYLILGWTASTNSLTMDIIANYASYDDYMDIGYVKTDSSGNLKAANKWSDHSKRTFGHTGNWNNGTQTIYTAYGLVYRVV